MARISSYPTDSTIQDKDSWIGTESTNRVTRNFTAEDVANYVVTSTSGITGGGTLNTIAMFTPDGQKIGDSRMVDIGYAVQVGTPGAGQQPTLLGDSFVNTEAIGATQLTVDNISAQQGGIVSLIGNVIIGDQATDILQISSSVSDYTGTGSTAAGQVLVSNASSQLEWTNIADIAGLVTGSGTTNTLPIWSDGPNGVLGDSGITQTFNANNKISNITLATNGADPNSLSASFGTGGSIRFTTGDAGEFMRLTSEVDGFYKSRFRFQNKVTVDRDSSSNGPSLDVGDADHPHAAAWFRNGVVVSNNPSGVQVDNTSMVIGGGNNDIVSGSDSCLAIGNNNQILSDSDNSLAVGQGNVIQNNADNCFAIGQSNVIDGTGAAQSVKSQVLGYQNNLTGSYSSFIAGGQNTVTTSQNAIALGFNHVLAGDDSMFAFGESNTGPSGASDNNSFMIGGNLQGIDSNMVIGFRNDTADYPATDYANGLGNTKFVVGVGSVNSSNALIITEGGVTRGGSGVEQIPRIILPQQETLEFTSDADATAGGIPTGGLYRSGNDLKINFNETAAGGNEGLAYLTPQLLTASATGSGNVDPNYNLVLVSWTGGNGVYTLNLPLASANTNRLIRITTDGSLAIGAGDKIDITAISGDTIDGNDTFQISKRYEGLAVYSTGSEWLIVQAKAH